jgi:hypothetical protein
MWGNILTHIGVHHTCALVAMLWRSGLQRIGVDMVINFSLGIVTNKMFGLNLELMPKMNVFISFGPKYTFQK